MLSWGSLAHSSFFETEFTSGGHKFKAEGMSNFKYPFVVIPDQHLLLVTHASTYWDSNKLTWSGITPLIEYFRSRNLPLKYLVSVHEKASTSSESYPSGIRVQDLHPFQGDSHRIVLQGESLVMTGGNFTICACNATRSIIALSESQGTLNIYFVMDGIYEGEGGVTKTLLDISAEKNHQEFMNYLMDSFFNRDGLPCKEATLFALDRTFRYEIHRHQKRIGHYGSGKNLVKMHFITATQVLSILSSR